MFSTLIKIHITYINDISLRAYSLHIRNAYIQIKHETSTIWYIYDNTRGYTSF